MKLKSLLTTTLMAATMLLWSNMGWGQETIAGWTFPTTTGNETANVAAECGIMAASSVIYADGTNGSDNWLGTSGAVVYYGGVAPVTDLCSVTAATGALLLVNVSSNFNNKGIVFKISLTGYESLNLSYSTRGTNTGFSNHEWLYSTDGIAFNSFTTITGRNATSFSTQSVDFSSITAIDNQPVVYIKVIVSAASGTGNNRFDNVRFTAFEISGGDDAPPVATFLPEGGATNVAIDVNPTITFNEAIRNIDDTEITDSNVDDLITFKTDDASGTDVAFDATIDVTKKVITIVPAADLLNDQVYYLAIAPVEDANDNATELQSITFTTIASSVTYEVTFSVVGGHGSLSAQIDGGAAITSGDFVDAGKKINFTASPEAGYQVKEWVLNGTPVGGNTTNDFSIDNLQETSNVTVEFELIPIQYTVTFTVTDGTDPIEGAIVTVAGTPLAATNAAGKTTIDLYNGSYTYTVTADNLFDWTRNFTVNDDDLAVSVTLSSVIVEDFDYPIGALLTDNGWSDHSGGVTQAIDITDGLVFPGYAGSDIGGAANVDNNGQDVNKPFTAQTSGTVYCAFLANVTSTYSGYFFHLGPNPIETTFRGRVFMDGGSGSNFNFGLSKGSITATSTTGSPYTKGTTYLLVLKYEIVEGASNDIVSLFVFDSMPTEEPGTPTIGPLTDAGQSDINPGSVALRQYNASQGVVIDGIRIAKTWAEAVKNIGEPPAATFDPLNNATDVAVTVNPTITFDKAIRNIDDSEITNENVASLITFKDALDGDVAFGATINEGKDLITITPNAALDYETVYTITLAPVEGDNNVGTATQSVSFTTEETPYPITFNVDVSVIEGFDPDMEDIYISGNFGGIYGTWVEPGDNANLKLTATGGKDASWYSVTLNLKAGTYEYKYYRNTVSGAEELGVGINRSITVVDKPITINDLWGDKDAGASIDPENAEFDLTNPDDVTTTITWYAATKVVSVFNGVDELTAGTEYSIAGNVLTINKAYLNGLTLNENDEVELTINFDVGDPATFTITVIESVITNATINPIVALFDLHNPADVSTTITWNDATGVTVFLNSDELSLGTDYTLAGNTLSISNTFISGIDGISEGDELGFDLVFDVGDPSVFTVNIAQSATINPLAADFDLYAPDNVETVITWNDATAIASINDGSDNLVLDTDYTVTDIDGSTATLAILPDYFTGVNAGDEVTLTISFNIGIHREFVISVVDNTPPVYDIIIADVVGGTATVVTDPVDEAPEGATVTVTISGIEAGKEFSSIEVKGADETVYPTTTITAGEEYTFEMPSQSVTVTVTIDEIVPEPELFVYWNFNDNTPASNTNWNQPIASTLGNGELTYTFTQAYSFAGTTINGVVGEVAGGSFCPRGGVGSENNGEYFILSFSTVGYEDIQISYPTTRTASGFSNHEVQYTINGVDWLLKESIDISEYVGWSADHMVEIDFTGVEGVEHNPSFAVRIILTGASSEGGNNRIDNIRVVGMAATDNLPPIISFNPAHGAVDVPVDVEPVISSNEPIFTTTGVPVDNTNVEGLITFVDGEANPVTFTATITGNKITIVPSADLEYDSEYTITMAAVQDEVGNAMDAPASATFTTAAATAQAIDLTSTHTGPYYAGEQVEITWTSANIDNVRIEVFRLNEGTWDWDQLATVPATDGSYLIQIPVNVVFGTQYRLRISDQVDGEPHAETGNFTIRAVANSIDDVRGYATNDEFRFDGTALVTATDAFNNRKFIEDDNSGILIFDTGGVITSVYNVGDAMTGLVGRKTVANNMMRIVPLANPGDPVSTGNAVVPTSMTIDAIGTNQQAMLVHLEDVSIVQSGTFANGVNYTLTDGTNTMVLRTDFHNVDYIGTSIPEVSFDVTGVIIQYNANYQLVPRDLNDFIVKSNDATLATFELGGEDVLELYGIQVNDPETDEGASLYVPDFDDFTGIVVTPTDANATVTITINGATVDEADYGTQTFANDDVVVATVVAENGTTTIYYKVTLTDVLIINATLDTDEVEFYENWPNDPVEIQITWNDATEVVSLQAFVEGAWYPMPPIVNDETFWEVINDNGETATLVIYIDNSPSKGYAGKEADFYTGETSLGRVVFNVGNPSEITFIFKLKTFMLTFDVVDGEGNPIPGAAVNVEPVDPDEDAAVVIPLGANQFNVGASQSYNYTVTAAGYEEYQGIEEDVVADKLIDVVLNVDTREVIARWDFENEAKREAVTNGGNDISLYTPDEGNGTISIVGALFTAWVQGNPGAGLAPNSTTWDGEPFNKYWQVVVSTSGYKAIRVSSVQRGSNTGPRDFSIQYSLNGNDWVDAVEDIVVANNFTSGVVSNAELPAECNNQTQLFLRWVNTTEVSVNGGTVAVAGTNRIDDIIITGEPAGHLPPQVTFNPTNGAEEVPVNVEPTITFSKPVRNLDDSEITNGNVAGLIGFTDGSDPVGFTATINEAKTLITITPDALLLKGVAYTITLAPVEDENDNATDTKSATFTTELPSTNATLATFTLGGEDVLILYGIQVNDPEADAGASLYVPEFEDFAGIVVTPTDANATVTITINGTPVDEADYETQPLANGDVVVATVVAENGTTTIYYKVTLTDVQIISATLDTDEVEFYDNWPNDPVEIEITWNDASEVSAIEAFANGVWAPLPPEVNGEPFWQVINDNGETATLVIYIDNSPAKGAGREGDYITGETSLGRVVFNVGNPSEIAFVFKLKTFLLSFDVVDGEGNPIPGATVTVVPLNQNESSAVVLPQGANQFEVGAGESYNYTVTAAGYVTAQGTVDDVMEDQSVEVEMEQLPQEPELIAYWNFNSNVPGNNQNWEQPIASTLGEGVLTYTFTQAYSFAGTTINGVEGEENGGSFAPRGGTDQENNGKYFILSVSTEGYDDIRVSYPTRRTGTGFTHQQVEYTINGTDWIVKETFDISAFTNDWLVNQLVDIDFAGVEGVGNNPNFAVRITLTGASTEAGNNRIDNIKVVGTADQGNLPPIVMFNPANGAVDVPVNVQPIISFSKPVRNLDNSEITNDNVAGLISFTDGTDPVGFTATINEAKTLITIVPNALLLKGEEYTITLSPVEDENDNATDTKSATFTTELPSGVATLATFTLGGEDALQLLGVVVNDPVADAGAILYVDDFTGFVGIEAIPTDANATVTVAINGTIIDEADFATQTFANGDVVLATVKAEDGTTTMYYKVTVVIDERVLELTSPLGGETFHAGDELTITWNSENIANVNLWVCDADGEPLHLINDEGPIPAANGTYTVTIENGVQGSFHIRVSDAIDPTFYDQTATTITIIDELMPSIVSRYPAHEATGVSIIFALSIGFDELITDGTGQFIIRKMSDDSQALAVTSQDFTIDDGTVTLPVANLEFTTEYYIDAVEGVFEDMYGNPSPAITKSGALQWHFTTMDEPDTDLFISEYIEGSGNNKALEIYNPTGIPVSLDNYRIAQATNGGGWEYYHYFPQGAVLAANDVWVIITDAIAPTLFDPANADEVLAYPSVVHFNGNDARAIERTDNGTDYYIIDVFGDPDSDANIDVAGVTGAAVDHTIVRKSSVLTGNTDWAASAGTNADDSEWIVYPINTFDYLGWHFYGLSQEADIIAFSVEYQMAPAVIDTENATVTLEVLHGSGLDAIVPEFTLSAGATAYINGEEQVSGTSVVDFTNPVVYTIVAEDGETEREWTVTITEAAVSTEAEILSFTVEGQASEEVINSQNATVVLRVMPGTDLTALVPQITISLGATIDPASGVAQDFSQPVQYTVTAQDGVTQKIWTVTITTIDLTPIHDIQFTEDESGNSPFAGQAITTSGIVTALHYNAPGGEFQGFFIQDGVGAWNGLYVYDKNLVSIAPSIGDYVVVSGMIKEYYGLTELTFDSQSGVQVEFVVISQGNELPEPFEVSTYDVNGESWESVLVKLTNAECIDANVGFGQKRVDDGSGPTLIDDDIYSAPLSLHVRYDIIGIAHYSYEEYKVLPRSVDDVSVTSVNTIAWGANINTYPNPFIHTIWIDNAHDVVRVNIFNLMGQQLMSIPVNSEDRLSISTDNLPFGVYLISIENARGERAVRKMIKNRY